MIDDLQSIILILTFGIGMALLAYLATIRLWIRRSPNGLGLGAILADMVLSLGAIMLVASGWNLLRIARFQETQPFLSELPLSMVVLLWTLIFSFRLGRWWARTQVYSRQSTKRDRTPEA